MNPNRSAFPVSHGGTYVDGMTYRQWLVPTLYKHNPLLSTAGNVDVAFLAADLIIKRFEEEQTRTGQAP